LWPWINERVTIKKLIMTKLMQCIFNLALSLLVVVQWQCTMGCAADESGMEGGFSAP
jgi:hypothetical protein